MLSKSQSCIFWKPSSLFIKPWYLLIALIIILIIIFTSYRVISISWQCRSALWTMLQLYKDAKLKIMCLKWLGWLAPHKLFFLSFSILDKRIITSFRYWLITNFRTAKGLNLELSKPVTAIPVPLLSGHVS